MRGSGYLRLNFLSWLNSGKIYPCKTNPFNVRFADECLIQKLIWKEATYERKNYTKDLILLYWWLNPIGLNWIHEFFTGYSFWDRLRIFYTNLHELFCQFICWTNWVNSGKFIDNCWIWGVMADMKKVYDDLIIINL